jgi:hypothetical protein
MVFRTKEKLRTGELAVSGDQWPLFLYQGYSYDPEDPWNGLFRSSILVFVSSLILPISATLTRPLGIQTCIYVPQLCR